MCFVRGHLSPAEFTQRLYTGLRNGSTHRRGDGPEDMLTRDRSALTTRLREAAVLRPGETSRAVEVESGPPFPWRLVCRGEGWNPGHRKLVEMVRLSVDRRLPPGLQWGVGKLRLEVLSRRLGKLPLTPRHKTRRSSMRRCLPSTRQSALWTNARRAGIGAWFSCALPPPPTVMDDALGPGQNFASAAIEVCDRLHARENEVAISWVTTFLKCSPYHARLVTNYYVCLWKVL